MLFYLQCIRTRMLTTDCVAEIIFWRVSDSIFEIKTREIIDCAVVIKTVQT